AMIDSGTTRASAITTFTSVQSNLIVFSNGIWIPLSLTTHDRSSVIQALRLTPRLQVLGAWPPVVRERAAPFRRMVLVARNLVAQSVLQVRFAVVLRQRLRVVEVSPADDAVVFVCVRHMAPCLS